MLTKLVVAFAVLALAAAFAGTVPAVAHVTFTQAVVLSGTTLQAGEYRLLIGDAKVTFSLDKQTFDIPAKIATAPKKFDNNEVECTVDGMKTIVHQINLGGTKTFLIFN